MEFNFIEDGVDAVVIDNFYTEDQLKEIMLELKWITKPVILRTGKEVAMATEADGTPRAEKYGRFLEEIFRDWTSCSLIKHTLENVIDKEFKKKLLEFNSMFKMMYDCGRKDHLLSYYENAGYYLPHSDHAVFTILCWFNTEPKKFTGGDMVLYSDDMSKKASIEYRNNRVLIIPSCTRHEVSKIESDIPHLCGDGRYCLASFWGLSDIEVDLEQNNMKRK
jgi:hypothetical protein